MQIKLFILVKNVFSAGNPEEYKNHLKKEYLLSRHQLFEVGDEND